MLNIQLPEPTKVIKVTDRKDVSALLKRTGGGVYFLYGKSDSLLYIGKTNSFRSRIADHLRGDGRSKLFARHIEVIKLYRFDDGMERDIYETYCINTYNPIYNASKVYRDNDKTHVYLEISTLIGERDDVRDRMKEISEELGYYDEEDFDKNDEYYYNDQEIELLGSHVRMAEEYVELERESARLKSRIQHLRERTD